MRAITLLLIVLLFVPHSGPLAAASPLTLYGRVARFVQPVYVDPSRSKAICTAVIVEHHLITAAHCFRAGRVLYLKGGRSFTYKAVRIKHDLAVIARTPKRGLELTDHHPPPGTPIWSFGYAFGSALTMSQGSIVGYPAPIPRGFFNNLPMQRYDGQVIGGMSGGPVVDADGRFVTQVSFGDNHGPAEILYSLPLSVFRGSLLRQ